MELQAWEIIDSMVSSWLLNVIDPKLHSTVAYADSAHAMWSTLKKRCGVANVPKIQKLKASIANCKQGGLDVVEFYSKLSTLWSELENYVKIPRCNCTGCTYGARSKVIKMIEEEKVH